MVSRAHTHKPTSRDRGPESKEDTQTDFNALNVLGNIPAPTTAIDACLDSGFHLNNGVKVSNGDGVLLVGGEAFVWRPWKAIEGAVDDNAARNSMLNAKGQFELDESVWGLLNLVWPKPGMFVLVGSLRPWARILEIPCFRIHPKVTKPLIVFSSFYRYANPWSWGLDVPALA